MEQTKKERQSNFELLRIITMFIIVVYHYCGNGGYIYYSSLEHINFNIIFTKIMGFGIAANHIFILLTGYFMVKSKVNYKRIISLVLQMFFYSIGIMAIFYGFGIVKFNKDAFARTLMPIIGGNWFLVYYLILYMLIPAINLIIEKLDKKQLKKIIITLVILYIVVPTFTENAWGFSRHDYFILDYLIGAYVRLYADEKNLDKKRNKKMLGLVFGISTMSVIVMAIIAKLLKSELIMRRACIYINNNYSILALGLAFYMFLVFKDIKVKNNKFINSIAASTLAVYLIHDHEVLRNWLWNVVSPGRQYINSNYYILHMFGKSIIIFVICVLIDKIRKLLLGKLENRLSESIYNTFKDEIEETADYS